MRSRQVPAFDQVGPRTAAGLALALASPYAAAALAGRAAPPVTVPLALLAAWLLAVVLTDKYRHKYPQRYDSYLIASHLKAALVMALVLVILRVVSWQAFALFAFADYLVSLPRKRAPAPHPHVLTKAVAAAPPAPPLPLDTAAVLGKLAGKVDDAMLAFARAQLPAGAPGAAEVVVLDDIGRGEWGELGRPAAVVAGRTRLNDVRRLNMFLGHCTDRTLMGGCLLLRYTPLDAAQEALKRRWRGPLYLLAAPAHFLWYRALPKLPYVERLYFHPAFAWLDKLVFRGHRNRALPKAEVWGRLAFWGFDVVAEEGDAEKLLLARRVSPPPANRRPSFFAVVALEKVGLDGELMRTHKVRSMYPFSEYLQRKIYESHGLTATGKFKNDFRLTEYGKYIRRHWLDELPGLYDWLHGEIKLVGMRATSPQFLGTYPRELYDLYIQTKPGLIPPIFDESTGGFDDIVRTELTYLKRYAAAPARTDIAYFWFTFRDIVFRRVRSF